MMIPATSERVRAHTDDDRNAAIDLETEQQVRRHGRERAAIERRLDALDREWDIERTLEANAATVSLIGLGLALAVDKRFLILPAAVAGFLLQHAVQGWCPPLSLFRRMGVRTAEEIARERYALKALRGDFAAVERASDPHARAEAAIAATRA